MTNQPKSDGRVIDPDWCSPIEALDLLEPHHRPATKDYIGDKLKDGRIWARELFGDCNERLVWQSPLGFR